MTFEEWMRRPVYVAQCKTWRMAAQMQLCCITFRCFPRYRDEKALTARAKVAAAMRAERAQARSRA